MISGRTAVGVGGLLGGLDIEARCHVAIRNGMVFSLECVTNKGGQMGSQRDCTWILGLSGFRVVTMEGDSGRLLIWIERRGARRYTCSGCGRLTCGLRSSRRRTWDDLPWARIT